MGITILLTHEKDPTSDFIQSAFKRNGKPISRVNVSETICPTLHISSNKEESWISDVNGERINASSIRSVIFRRPTLPIFSDNEMDNRFLSREFLYGLRAFFEASDAIWMNHPQANTDACSKLSNLWLAREIGFNVPKSIVSSAASEIERWAHTVDQSVIKSVSFGLLEEQNSARMAFTQRLPKEFNPSENLIEGVPSLFQEEVSKAKDIRIVVVGKNVFSASLPDEKNEIDWRKSSLHKPWDEYNLPPCHEALCVTLCEKLGLEFAAIDMIETPQGDLFFLEINPNGQWVWLEQEAKLPISDQIVAQLTEE